MKKTSIFVGFLVACGAALAQQAVIGKTAEVQGLVTISDSQSVRNARNGSLVVDRSRIVTSSSGQVLIRLENGCDITMKPNESLVVDYSRECRELIASIQNLSDPRMAVAALGGGGAGQLLQGISAVLGVALLDNPRTGGSGTPGGGTPGGGGGQIPISGQ